MNGQTIDAETGKPVNDTTPTAAKPFPTVSWNAGSTFESPFFYVLVGLALGVWICKADMFKTKLF